MKIDQMRLIAYGPFTDKKIDFSGGVNFHLVYGPNEAGKSTALRALRNLLFGIPVRTDDSFLHPNPNLRIGARLAGKGGRTIAFVRRKGQGKTLRSPDEQSVLDDESLAPFLGGINRELFEQMFAIGHEDLVKGGEEIVSGGGSVGQALFAAGAGLIQLQSFRQNLEKACDALFRPSGQLPEINKLLALLKDVGRSQKEALLPMKTWKARDRALQDAYYRAETVRQNLFDLKQESGRLARIQKALSLIARRKEILEDLTGYEGVPELS